MSRRSLTSFLRVGALVVVASATVVVVSDRVEARVEARVGSRVAAPRAPVQVSGVDDKATTFAPWSRLPFGEALATSAFLRDRSAFAYDLVRTGKVKLPRALRLADVAVRESYRRQVPPALVLGVMLTENDELKSTARSRQGAIGLMQIHPGPWRPALGKLFGRNLRNDTTNLRYGVFILSHVSRQSAKRSADSGTHWRSALLRYNGCVRGSNTRDCFRYPDIVRREVLRSARTICAGRDFEQCVVDPLRIGSKARS